MLPPSISPDTLGRDGESIAARFLLELGYDVLGCNHKTAIGEIDLVALDGRTLVFVEVKTRADTVKGRPEDAITAGKRRKLSRLAVAFMKEYEQFDRPCRFDVVAIDWPEGAAEPSRIRHHPDAFPASGGYEAY